MEKKSKILLIVLVILVVVSVYLSYVRIFVYKDYSIVNSADTENPDLSIPASIATSSDFIFPDTTDQ